MRLLERYPELTGQIPQADEAVLLRLPPTIYASRTVADSLQRWIEAAGVADRVAVRSLAKAGPGALVVVWDRAELAAESLIPADQVTVVDIGGRQVELFTEFMREVLRGLNHPVSVVLRAIPLHDGGLAVFV